MANDGGGFTTGLLLGGIIGAFVGILIAPKPGSETRAQLWEKSDYLRERAEDISSTVIETVGPAIDTLSEKVGPAIENARELLTPTVDNPNERFTPLVDQVNERFSESTTSHVETATGPEEDKTIKPS